MNVSFALTLTLLIPLTASGAVLNPHAASPVRASASDIPALHVYGSRDARHRPGTAGAKLDAALAELSSYLGQVRPETALEDLHSLSPAARFMQRPSRAAGATPLVLVDAVTRGDAQKLKNALDALGLQNPAIYLNDVSGWLPVDKIEAATARTELHSMRAAMSRAR